MTGQLVRDSSPEELELQKKQAELSALETQLAQRELDLATFQAELHAFERHYLQTVGIRHQELDRIEAQISEYMAHLGKDKNFRPTNRLKQLYRDVAKRIHPDLATDPEERTRREALMAAANRAYEEGDEARLQAILKDWELSPDAVTGRGPAADLIRTLRKIAQSQGRLQRIERQLKKLEKTELHQLQLKVDRAQDRGRDLLAEMARQVDGQIAKAQKRLNDLKAKVG